MPIYEFECRSCGHVWDELQKSSDPDPDTCPNCANPVVVRRMTAAAFRLKGAGWYETDFKKEGDTKRNLVEGSSGEPAKSDSASSPASSEKTPEKTAPVETSTSEKVVSAPTSAPSAPTPPAPPKPTSSAS